MNFVTFLALIFKENLSTELDQVAISYLLQRKSPNDRSFLEQGLLLRTRDTEMIHLPLGTDWYFSRSSFSLLLLLLLLWLLWRSLAEAIVNMHPNEN